MTDFVQRQAVRKARREKHQRESNKLMHKLGGLKSVGWNQHVHTIYIRQGKIIYHAFQAKTKKLIAAGDMKGLELLKKKWHLHD